MGKIKGKGQERLAPGLDPGLFVNISFYCRDSLLVAIVTDLLY